MTDKKRDPLPAGYQFGDAGKMYRHDGVLMAQGNRLVLRLPLRYVEYFTSRDLGDEAADVAASPSRSAQYSVRIESA